MRCRCAAIAPSTTSVKIAPAAPARSVVVHIGRVRVTVAAASGESSLDATRPDRAGRGERCAARRRDRHRSRRRVRRLRSPWHPRNPWRSSVTTDFRFATAPDAHVIPRPGRPRSSFRRLFAVLTPPTDALDWVVLTDTALPVETLHAWASTPGSGAVVCFFGIVRDHAEGRAGVRGDDLRGVRGARRRAMARDRRESAPALARLERIALLHRVGELALSEASVAVVGLGAAPRRRVRRRRVLHRHIEGNGADLEAGALGRAGPTGRSASIRSVRSQLIAVLASRPGEV